MPSFTGQRLYSSSWNILQTESKELKGRTRSRHGASVLRIIIHAKEPNPLLPDEIVPIRCFKSALLCTVSLPRAWDRQPRCTWQLLFLILTHQACISTIYHQELHKPPFQNFNQSLQALIMRRPGIIKEKLRTKNEKLAQCQLQSQKMDKQQDANSSSVTVGPGS